MRQTVPTDTFETPTGHPSIHPLFLPFLADIEAAETAQGPLAAAGLYVETLSVVGKLIERAVKGDAETCTLLAEKEVDVTDLVAMADHLGDRIEAIFKKLH